MAQKLRIGFIGAGGIAVGHARRLHATGVAEVVALADPSAESIHRIRAECPELAEVPAFSDHRQMLEAVSLDAVEIHSPHCFHTQQILDALEAGKHVLCEKPMTPTAAEARQVIAKRDEVGKVLMVSYQRHYEATYRFIREKVLGGELGRLQMVSIILSQDWLRGTRGTWRQDPAISCGGQLNDSGSHFVDIMLWCTGLHPSKVYAQINNYDAQVDIDSAIAVRFREGAIGTLAIMGGAPTPFWEFFGVWGSAGALLYDRTGGLQWQNVDTNPVIPPLPPCESNPDLNFVRAILGLEQVEAPAECGLRVAEFTEAAWRSAATGQPVSLE